MTTSEHPSGPPPRPERPRENLGQRRLGRGAFVGIVAAGVGTLFAGGAISRVTSRVTRPLTDNLGLAGIVPTSGWRIYTVAATMPHFDPASWRLTVGGLVEQPLSLSYDELRALPRVQQVSDFHCVTGWIVKNVTWTGVRLDEVLKRARPTATAAVLNFVSAERPYEDTLTRTQAALPDVLLAYEQDGVPLPRQHGAPLRLVIPDMYGYKSVKWVQQIDLVEKPVDGYWEQRGYDRDAWIGRSNGS